MFGCPYVPAYSRLKSLKRILKEKNRNCYGEIHRKILQARVRLDVAQQAVLSSRGCADGLKKERELT